MLRSIFAVGVPTFAAALALSLLSQLQEENAALRNMATLAESISVSKDRQFSLWKLAVERLADSYVVVREFNLENLHWTADRLTEDVGGWVVMTDADDVQVQYFNTRFGSYSPVRTEAHVPEMDATVARTRQSGQPEISNVFEGPRAKTDVIVAARTVTASTGDEYLLALTFEAKVLSESFAAMTLPPGLVIYMSDGTNRIVASSNDHTAQMLPDWQVKAFAEASGTSHGPSLFQGDNATYLYAHHNVPGAPGWNVLISQPRNLIANATYRDSLPVAGALIVMLLTGMREYRRRRSEQRQAEFRLVQEHLTTERVLRADLESSLERVRALESARRRMLGILGHEMRTPVLSAMAAIELRADKAQTTAEGDQLRLAARGLKLLHSLVDDILDLTRMDAGEFRLEANAFGISQVLEEAADILQPMAERHRVPLIRDWPKADLRVMGDAGRVRQILINLISNAIKYAPQGPITLSGSWRAEEGRCRIRLCVIDRGPGISEDKIEGLFEPFARLQSDKSSNITGLGLGLAITRRLAGAMGGEIEVNSRLGEGSTFCLSLVLPLAGKATEPHTATPPGALEGRRILMVEDHPLQAAVIEALLTSLSAQVTIASTGKEALDLQSDQAFELILIDLGLPDMSGVELVTELRRRGSTAAHVALSANPSSLLPEERAQFDEALSKTSGRKDIAAVVCKMLEQARA